MRAVFRFIWDVFLALVIVAAAFNSGLLGHLDPPQEVRATDMEDILRSAPGIAHLNAAATIDEAVDELYMPIYAAVPEYVNSSYPLMNQKGLEAEELQKHLFKDFDAQFKETAMKLDRRFVREYKRAVDYKIRGAVGKPFFRLGPVTRPVLESAKREAATTSPILDAVSEALASGALTSWAVKMALRIQSKMAAKRAAKEKAKRKAKGKAAKLVGKGSVCGPFALLCLLIHAVNTLDLISDLGDIAKAISRAEFERELRMAIDEDREEKELFLRIALAQKAKMLEASTLRRFNGQ